MLLNCRYRTASGECFVLLALSSQPPGPLGGLLPVVCNQAALPQCSGTALAPWDAEDSVEEGGRWEPSRGLGRVLGASGAWELRAGRGRRVLLFQAVGMQGCGAGIGTIPHCIPSAGLRYRCESPALFTEPCWPWSFHCSHVLWASCPPLTHTRPSLPLPAQGICSVLVLNLTWGNRGLFISLFPGPDVQASQQSSTRSNTQGISNIWKQK